MWTVNHKEFISAVAVLPTLISQQNNRYISLIKLEVLKLLNQVQQITFSLEYIHNTPVSRLSCL